MQIDSFARDIHLYPLHLKFSANSFREGKTDEGMAFFGATIKNLAVCSNAVYEKLWEIKGKPEGDYEYGRKSFHGLDGFSSSALEKAKAIEECLKKYDQNELDCQAKEVYRQMWEHHWKPQGNPEYGRHAFHDIFGYSSSLESKLYSIWLHANESRLLSWITDKEQVDLFTRARGGLVIQYHDVASKKINYISFDSQGLPVKEVVSTLKKCDLVMNQGVLTFEKFLRYKWLPDKLCKNLLNPDEINCDKYKISLISKDDQPYWRVFYKQSGVSSYFPGNDQAIYLLKCLEKTPKKNRGLFLKDFNLRIDDQPGPNRATKVRFVKLGYRSQLDPKKIADRDTWLVTLINGGESTRPVWGFRDNQCGHAELIIEGFKKGHPFAKIAHLSQTKDTPPNYAKVNIIFYGFLAKDIKKRFIPKIDYNDKGPTWERSPEWVKKIKSENGKLYAFNLTGNVLFSNHLKYFKNAISIGWRKGWSEGVSGTVSQEIYKEEKEFLERINPKNCLTWAEHGASLMGIDLPPIGPLIASPKRYIKSLDPNLVKLRN